MFKSVALKGFFSTIQVGSKTIEALGELVRQSAPLTEPIKMGYREYVVYDGTNRPVFHRVMNGIIIILTAVFDDDGSLESVLFKTNNHSSDDPISVALKAGTVNDLHLDAHYSRLDTNQRNVIFNFLKGLVDDADTAKLAIPDVKWLDGQSHKVNGKFMSWLDNNIDKTGKTSLQIVKTDAVSITANYRYCGGSSFDYYSFSFDVRGLGRETAGTLYVRDSTWRSGAIIPDIVQGAMLKAIAQIGDE